MSNSVFLNYGVSYFDLLSARIDNNEAEIVDIDFAKINRPDPATPNALLYLTDGTGRETASSSILCQADNALQNVGCIQLPLSPVNPASVIPELAGQESSTVWLNQDNGHLYRGSVDLESGGGATGDVVGPASSVDNQIALFNGATGKLIKTSLTKIDSSGFITMPTTATGTIMTYGGRTFSNLDRTTSILGYGRNTTRVKTILVGTAGTDDSLAITEGIVVGHNSCAIGSGTQSDVIAIGNDIGTASGSSSIIVGNRVCLEPTSVNSLGTGNIALGHDINIYNSSLSNILLGNSVGVRGTANVLIGDSTLSSQPISGSNVVIGCEAAKNVSTANNNVLIGAFALTNATGSSSSNILIGGNVGDAITTSVNNCLWLEASGSEGETNTTRIGKSDKQACYVGGIYGYSTLNSGQKNVKILSDGRLVASRLTASYSNRTYNNYASPLSTSVTSGVAFELIPPTIVNKYSSDSLFTSGANNARIKYVGADTITAKATLSLNIQTAGANTFQIFLQINGTTTYSTVVNVAASTRYVYNLPFVIDLSNNGEVSYSMLASSTSSFFCYYFSSDIVVLE